MLLVVAGLVIFFVARPMLSGAGGGGQSIPMLATLSPGSAGYGGAAPALADARGGQLALGEPSALEERIDIARIEGQVKLSSVKKVSEFVDRHPEESVSILRSWLHES